MTGQFKQFDWKGLWDAPFQEWDDAIDGIVSTHSSDLVAIACDENEARETRLAALDALSKKRNPTDIHKVFPLVHGPDAEFADFALSAVAAACRSVAAARNFILATLVSEPDVFLCSSVFTDVMDALEKYADEFEFVCNAPEPHRHGADRGELPNTKNPRVMALLAMADASGKTLQRLLTAEASVVTEKAIGLCAAARPEWRLSRHLNLSTHHEDPEPEVLYAAWEAARTAAMGGDTAEVEWLLCCDAEAWNDPDRFWSVANKRIAKRFYPSPGLVEEDFEKDRFYALLGEAQAAISAMAEVVPSWDRWQMHQDVSAAWQRRRANKLGIELVRGVFPAGTVSEESLFHTSAESVDEHLGLSEAIRYSVIGRGCADLELLQHEVVPEERRIAQDYGWESPGYPDRVEYAEWDEEGNLRYFRQSGTGRTAYTLSIDAEGKITLL